MRSDLVFSAAVKTPNRYLLCRMLSVSARHMSTGKNSFAEGINSVLMLAGNSESAEAVTPAQEITPAVNNQLSRMVGLQRAL